jgi:hypothetical protein
MKPIPAVWRIDIEPDDFQPGPGLPAWSGFVAAADFVERLRRPLADRSGTAVHPTWFLRLDPDIERCYGRADFVVDHYRAQIDQLRSRGDPFGIHVHYYRWDEQRRVSYSDHADTRWTTHCLDSAARTFERCFGEPPRRASQGGYFVTDAVVDRAIALGIEVDVTAEPGLEALHDGVTFGAYTTAPSPDFRQYPRRPYYPSRADLGSPATSATDARPMLMVPLTSYDYDRARNPWHKRIAKNILRLPRQPLPLNPWKAWPSPGAFWDLVARAADEGPARYAAFAIRSDAAGSETYVRARMLLEHLPSHPISRRLRFVDPLSPEIRALVAPYARRSARPVSLSSGARGG